MAIKSFDVYDMTKFIPLLYDGYDPAADHKWATINWAEIYLQHADDYTRYELSLQNKEYKPNIIEGDNYYTITIGTHVPDDIYDKIIHRNIKIQRNNNKRDHTCGEMISVEKFERNGVFTYEKTVCNNCRIIVHWFKIGDMWQAIQEDITKGNTK